MPVGNALRGVPVNNGTEAGFRNGTEARISERHGGRSLQTILLESRKVNQQEHPMDFRIADTFTDSLARLTGEEQKAVKTTAFDLQVNPAARYEIPQARKGEGQELLVGAGRGATFG